MIWVEIGGEIEPLRTLAAAIDAATARLGVLPESREFRPHLTIGRVKGPGRGDWRSVLESAGGAGFGEIEVTEYVLYESRLEPAGAVYSSIQRFPLAERSATEGRA